MSTFNWLSSIQSHPEDSSLIAAGKQAMSSYFDLLLAEEHSKSRRPVRNGLSMGTKILPISIRKSGFTKLGTKSFVSMILRVFGMNIRKRLKEIIMSDLKSILALQLPSLLSADSLAKVSMSISLLVLVTLS